MDSARERTAVLVIRAWIEGGEPTQVRARITSTRDVDDPGSTETIGAASEQDVVKAVRRWLRAFRAGR